MQMHSLLNIILFKNIVVFQKRGMSPFFFYREKNYITIYWTQYLAQFKVYTAYTVYSLKENKFNLAHGFGEFIP